MATLEAPLEVGEAELLHRPPCLSRHVAHRVDEDVLEPLPSLYDTVRVCAWCWSSEEPSLVVPCR